MPKFFFEIADAYPAIPCVGFDLPTLSAARCHALRYAGQLLCDQAESFWSDAEWTMTVTNHDHLTLFLLTIDTLDAPAVTRAPSPAYTNP
jgi:hypothetical protein